VADGAIGALLAGGRIEAVLLAADAVAANGDVAARAGAYPIAVVAARHAVPLIVCVPTAAIDLATPDGAALPGIATEADAEDPWGRGPAGAPSFDPGVDVTPASLVSVLLTEEGAIHPPFDAALRDAVAASDARRPPIPAPHPQAAA
jgi:methylthioribose-1-phosphate isomerase